MKQPKQKMISIRPDADVRDMLKLARSKGQKINYLGNEALRIYLPKIGFNIKKSSK